MDSASWRVAKDCRGGIRRSCGNKPRRGRSDCGDVSHWVSDGKDSHFWRRPVKEEGTRITRCTPSRIHVCEGLKYDARGSRKVAHVDGRGGQKQGKFGLMANQTVTRYPREEKFNFCDSGFLRISTGWTAYCRHSQGFCTPWVMGRNTNRRRHPRPAIFTSQPTQSSASLVAPSLHPFRFKQGLPF